LRKGLLNRNSLPFLLLTFIHLVIFLKLFKRKREYTWTLLLSNIGFAFFFEYFVLNLFQAYTYKPSILKIKYLDNILGAILSQAFYVPITATFLTIYKKNWQWKISFITYFYIVEQLFLRLGIYKTNWWNPKFTSVLMLMYFYTSDFFYKMIEKRKYLALKLAQYLTIVVIDVTFMYTMAVRRKLKFGIGFLHTWKEHFILAPIYSLILSFFSTFISSQNGILYRIYHLLYFLVVDYFLIKVRFVKINYGTFLQFVPWHLLMIYVSRLVYKEIFQTHKKEHPSKW
jgi:hypothetical protein